MREFETPGDNVIGSGLRFRTDHITAASKIKDVLINAAKVSDIGKATRPIYEKMARQLADNARSGHDLTDRYRLYLFTVSYLVKDQGQIPDLVDITAETNMSLDEVLVYTKAAIKSGLLPA